MASVDAMYPAPAAAAAGHRPPKYAVRFAMIAPVFWPMMLLATSDTHSVWFSAIAGTGGVVARAVSRARPFSAAAAPVAAVLATSRSIQLRICAMEAFAASLDVPVQVDVSCPIVASSCAPCVSCAAAFAAIAAEYANIGAPPGPASSRPEFTSGVSTP